MQFADLSPIWLWICSIWLAVLGGCVGSFLNVVVYRLPAGKSLIRPGSRCPKCGHPIRWYDNVPVFGWLLLRGRCRDCREPISFRYPFVEGLTAAIFFGLAWIELLSGGANLPALEVFEICEQPRPLGILRDLATGEVVGIYASHLLLLCTLLAAALIEYDQRRIPLRLFVPALLVGVIAPSAWPPLSPGVIVSQSSGPTPWWLVFLLLRIAAGLCVGWVLGWFVPRQTKDEAAADVSAVPAEDQPGHDARGTRQHAGGRADDGAALSAVCVGLLLGFWAVLLLGAAAFVLTLAGTLLRRAWHRLPRIGPVTWLAVLVPVWIVFWRTFATGWVTMFG